jgi:SpoVK/Ycf46/Vps4 family AAA+-type ATPase
MKVSLKTEVPEAVMQELVELTDGYSYSDIETAVKEVAQKAIINSSAITTEGLKDAIRSIIPITGISPELVAEIDCWGKDRAVNVSREVI